MPTMTKKKTKTKARAKGKSDALGILSGIAGKSVKMQRLLQNARRNAEIARQIYEARTKAGLSQRELAELVGTSHSAINRLEDADYEGHSVSLLRRIADALHYRIEFRMVPERESASAHH